MKKKLFLTCLIGLMFSTSVYAKCEGGTEITNTVGTTFCKSNVKMNWWSAFAWCKANGLHLATMYEMCPSWNGNKGSGKCPELNGAGTGGDVWSSTAYDIDSAFVVSDGYVRNSTEGGFYRNSGYFAFCI